MPKRSVTFRFSEETLQHLAMVAEARGTTRTQALEMLIMAAQPYHMVTDLTIDGRPLTSGDLKPGEWVEYDQKSGEILNRSKPDKAKLDAFAKQMSRGKK